MDETPQSPRLQARLKVFQPTVVRIAGVERRAHFLNLSVTGALLHCTTPPPAGSAAEVGCCGTMRFGRVRWANDHYFGFEFQSPLSEMELAEAVAAREAMVTAEGKRIGTLR